MYYLKDIYFINFETFMKNDELLTAYTSEENVPFNLKRIFITGNVSKHSNRGSHAHKETSQIFICLQGTISIRCNDSIQTKIFKLTNQKLGLFIPPTIWYDTIYEGSNNSILVLSNKEYIKNDYILSIENYFNFRKDL